jgi:hypothetical protein
MRALRAFVVMAGTVTLTGCSAAVWDGVGAVAQGYAQAAAATTSTKLMLFGGSDHRTYLGCLNCSEYDGNSVFNQFGSFGSPYSSSSIANQFSEFGSVYSMYSACNPYATDPPVIVDGNGQFYGRLTINQYHAQRTTSANILAWLAAVCAR